MQVQGQYGLLKTASKAAVAVWFAFAAVAHADETQILALGDSLTQGYGLPQEDGFVPQMQSWLDAQGQEATIINAGVSGDTTAGGLSRVAWSRSPEVDVMIVALGGNDLLRGLPPETSRANLKGILDVAKEQEIPVLLVGLYAPSNYGADYKSTFDAIYPDLSKEYDTLYFPDFFEGLRLAGATAADNRAFMQADGIHPNAKGVTQIVKAMGPTVVELINRAGE
jgi:acyl-CoA thioesterase-1